MVKIQFYFQCAQMAMNNFSTSGGLIRPLVFILRKMSGYGKFKVKNGDKDKNNKLMSLHLDDDNLIEKYKVTWTKIEDLKNIELNAIPVYDYRYIETKIKTYGQKVFTNFCGLNVPENGVECESSTVIDSLLAYENKFYLWLLWHPTRSWDWCMSENEKKNNQFLLIKINIKLGSGKELPKLGQDGWKN